MTCIIDDNITKYIVQPASYVKGWTIINSNLNIINENKLTDGFCWYYINFKNISNIHEFLSTYNETFNYSSDYINLITNNCKKSIIIAKNNNIISTLLYNFLSIQFNCSKINTLLNSAIIHNIKCISDKNILINLNLTKVINLLNSNDIKSAIILSPTILSYLNATQIIPMLIIEQYKLKIPMTQEISIHNKIIDYDEIPKNNEIKINKLNEQLYVLYINEIKKYKISNNLSKQAFIEKYINSMHKIYMFINDGNIIDFLICINDDILKLDFYTLNEISLKTFIEYVAMNDEIIINNQMFNYELLIPKYNPEKIGEKYIYLFNIFVKKINPKNYSIIFF